MEDSEYKWPPEFIAEINSDEQRRNLVIRAIRKSLTQLYYTYFQEKEIVLEVGSGTGFLRRNLPEILNGEWIQLDSQPAFLEDAKRRFLNGIYTEGSAYDLPFPDKSIDGIWGHNSFTVLSDLEAAIRECSRVLKDDGVFMHSMDLGQYQERDTQHAGEKTVGHVDLMSLNIYLLGRLHKSLSLHFDPTTIKTQNIITYHLGKRTDQQRDKDGYTFVGLPGDPNTGSMIIYLHLKEHGFEKVGVPTHPKIKSFYLEFYYGLLRNIVPLLASLIEPPSLEISVMQYAFARK